MLGYAAYGFSGIGEKQKQAQSSEEELGCGNKSVSQPQSPWQRIKWTDSMVRLLICAVQRIGEDVAASDCDEQKGKKATGVQQKKGKWKRVSRAMMEKGFYVSPQQCEDKFNDLNKRYKRVNELVGKEAVAIAAVNPTLLDSLVESLPGKAMEEAHKLLFSKHLFFREMFAYHNTSPVSAAAVHTSFLKECNSDQSNGEERNAGMSPAALSSPPSLSLSSLSGGPSTPLQQLKSEVMGMQGEQQEQRGWLRMKAMELEERRVVYQNMALKLERQRLKWLRFCGGKEREMERMRLRNERRRLENDRMLLLLHHEELSLVDAGGKLGEVEHRDDS